MRSRALTTAVLAGALALMVAYAGLRWGALVAGGSDSYGYVSQAELWRRGNLVVHQDVVRPTPWPLAADTWTPLGYRPSPHARDGYVPLYAPGLPLLMAAAQAIAGFCAAFAVVPLCGALTIWLTFVLGGRMFPGPAIALGGAVLVAVSPVFLYQLMNAMSDVPVTAFWTLALVLAVSRRPFASGLAMAMTIAIRPNLAPLAAVIGVWTWRSGDRDQRRRAIVRFAAGAAPAVVGLAWLHAVLYESPWVSGYGTTGDLYALGYFGANVANYMTWLAAVETPIVALAAIYVATPHVWPALRLPAARALIGGTMAVMLISYVFYEPFNVWWYLRFLLPMWPVMMLATVAAIDGVAARASARVRPIVVTTIVAVLAGHHLLLAEARHVFDLGRMERKYVDVARFVAAHTEPDAVVLSHQHSGSLRLYAGRLTLRYDLLDPAWLDRALTLLQSAGRRPYLALDGDEVAAFRERFLGTSRAAALDWPPIATLNGVVNIYDPLDRIATGSPLSIASTRGTRTVFACETPYSRPPVRLMK
ncbi:MAG TPA: hypothetical protein VKE96_22875 [Vicinamibacterales bacterium]|nr:hypothetical protein [Vicinamibacterales bacterium]